MFPQIHIQFLTPHAVLWLVPGIAICLFLSIFAYRQTLPPLAKGWRIFLAGLRFSALLLLLFVLLQPVIQVTRRSIRPKIVGLLWDGSRSMEVSDHSIVRSDILNRIDTYPNLKPLESRYNVQSFLFSDRLDSIPPNSQVGLSFTGTATDLAAILAAFQKRDVDRHVCAAILVSDGRITQGANPIRTAQTFGFPIHTVRIGESAEKADLILDDVKAIAVAYVDNTTQIEAVVRAPNLGGKAGEIQLRRNGEILSRKSLVLPAEGGEVRAELPFTPRESGFQKLQVVLPRLEDEFTDENNARDITIQVLKRKMSVLLLAGAPGVDIGFFRRMLAADPDVDLTIRTAKQDGGFYEGAMPSTSELRDFDLFVFLDFPSREVAEPAWMAIRQTLVEDGAPLFLSLGKHVNLQRLSQIQFRLPVVLAQNSTEREVHVSLTAEGRVHPVMQIHESEAENDRAWEGLPTLFSSWRSIRLQNNSQVLGETDRNPGMPLIVVGQMGQTKSLMVLGTGLARWDLMMQGIGEGNTVVRGFIEKSFRWLVLRENTKPVRVATDKRVYRAGETMKISVQAVDGLSNPVNDARIHGTLETASARQEIRFSPTEAGSYDATARSFEAGDGRIVVEASRGDQQFGRDTTDFTISRFSPEFLDTRSDPDLMKALAGATGGLSVSPDSLDAIIKTIDCPPEIVEKTREFSPLGSVWVLVLVLLLLSAEWFFRKRRGLP